ncbi:MAG: YggS family pyridoxal phosphate-dependent enzyme [Bacteroidetes bacterium]|nr:YggS family pyridoxal phosphate-dependent enzyme [Bacteroidota bacterium]
MNFIGDIKSDLQKIKSTLPTNVTLVAVSKTKPNEDILQAYNAGQLIFGENYVQELVDKQNSLPKDIKWHFIGHLQSNKVKYIAPFVTLIHGVDSLSLLKEINKQAQKNNRIINCLLQVFIAKEETKFGFDYNEINSFFNTGENLKYPNVNIVGFMGMASNTDNTSQIKLEFETLAALYKSLQQKNNFNILSMGMSNDYDLAIKCGSNMVRIGSLIFGNRNYSK